MDSDRNFSFGALLRMQTHENQHKVKPMQFISVAEGVKKRLESNVKNKRRTRLTHFDIFRNLPESKPPVQKPLNKLEQRLLQLQKWKEEKEKKKVEALKKKKIPFVVGIPKSSRNFEPPPPLPSTSGRVTRSQAARSNLTSNNETQKVYTFAPQNAAFNPSLKGLDKPTLSTYEEKKYETHKKQSAKSPNNVPNQQPRCLHSKSKLKGETTVKITQNELNAQKKSIPKSKPLANQPLKDPKIFSSTTSSSLSDGDTYTKKTVTSVKKTETPRKGRKTANTTKKEDHSKSTATTKSERLVDLSNCSNSMETDDDKPSHRSEMLADVTVTPNKQNAAIKDFITFSPKNPVPKSESSSEEKLRSPNATDVPMTPQQINEEVKKFSPRVYLSREKENTRKEMKKTIDEGLVDEDVCDMSVDVEHFRRQLDSKVERMTEMCEVWDTILEQTTLPDEIQEAALAALGQARLLMAQKLQQFASLLRRCERPEPGTALVTLTDLQGFWDMVILQIEKVDIRFKKLELSRARGWASEEPTDVARRPKPPQPKPSQPKPAERARPAPNNRLKDIIAAARKAKKANTNTIKTFEAGFFSLQSPVKSRAAATPRRKPSLLQSVLSSEAKKSSYAMMRASLMGKNVDSEDVEIDEANIVPLTPINLDLTPEKSILKSNNNTATKVASKISFKLFNMDTASDSSPTSDDGQISGVEKLRDLDTSQNSSESSLAKEHNLENSQSLEKSPKSLKLPNLENLQLSDNLPNVEDNLVNTDAEKLAEVKGKRRFSRKIRESLHKAEDVSELATETHAEEKVNRRSTRKLRASLHNAEENSELATETYAEEKENRRSTRNLRASLHNAEENSELATETHAEENVNRRLTRKLRASLHNAEENSELATETHAEENVNRRLTRKLRASLHNAEENSELATETHAEENVNRRLTRKLRASLHNAEENSELATETHAEGKENRRSTRNLRASLHNAEENSELATETHAEENVNRRLTRKLRASLHNAEENSELATETHAEGKENRRSTRNLRASLHNAEENSELATETHAEENVNRRLTRKLRASLHNAEENSELATETHAEEKVNRRSTRNLRASSVTPTSTRSRRRV